MTTPALAQDVKGKGRHYLNPETEVLVPSVTNVIGSLDKPGLMFWAARTVAEQAVALAGSLQNLDPSEAVDMLKGSPWRNSNRAASRGTNVHTIVENILNGQSEVIINDASPEAKPYLAQALRFFADHEVKPWHTEVSMFGDGYAGTCDFVGTIDGTPCLIDWKTGKNGPYKEVALQLSALGHTEFAVINGEPQYIKPMPQLWLAVHFTPDKYKIVQVEDSYEAFRHLLHVWHWRNGDNPLSTWTGQETTE